MSWGKTTVAMISLIGIGLLVEGSVYGVQPTSPPSVTLYATSPQVRTGQSVELEARASGVLMPGSVLEIVDTTTDQVISSTNIGNAVTATVTHHNAMTQRYQATLVEKSAGLKVQWVDHGIGNNAGYSDGANQTVTLQAPAIDANGAPFTVRAVPHGFVHPVYEFWWARIGGQWHTSGSYSASSTYQITPVAPDQGLFVAVYAREATAPANETPAQRAIYEAKSATSLVQLQTASASSGTSSSNPTTPGWVGLAAMNAANVGQNVTLSASSGGLINPVYQFWFRSPGGEWQSSGGYQSTNQFVLPLTQAGTWSVVAYARDAAAPKNETQYERTVWEKESAVISIKVW